MTQHRPVTSETSLVDLIARAEADPASDEAHFLSQLRAAISGCETRVLPYISRTRSPRPELKVIRATD